jgi:hypothetical protein
LKYAGYPDCRTCRSERTRHIRAEWPTRKNATRKLCISTGAVLLRRQHSLSRCACGTGEDYRSDKRDITISDSPGNLRKG